MRILEIGENILFQFARPNETDTYFAGYRDDLRAGLPYLGLINLVRIMRRAYRSDYDLIVLHPPLYPGWHPRSFLAALKFSLLRGNPAGVFGAVFSPLWFEFLRLLPNVPIIAVDRSDNPGTPAHHFFLLDKAEIFFKRELPYDHWQLLNGTAHRRLPGRTFRLQEKWRRRMAKVKPIGLGLPHYLYQPADAAFGQPKTSDVFFSATTSGNSTVRSNVGALIDLLSKAGVKVDVAEGRLPQEEFAKRCAQAWLTLSPAGLGWECYRHLEAAVAGSVPLLSAPTIHRYKPLVIGEHCLVYYPDEQRIVEIVEAALSDKMRLADMAIAARQHVLDWHTEQAICRYLIEECRAQISKRSASQPTGRSQSR
ncbi:MAG: glycosyltransferase [Alphaproteobacteria bacterium]|nr:glycosyltransferase [Alphaproteobacteria bacterium]